MCVIHASEQFYIFFFMCIGVFQVCIFEYLAEEKRKRTPNPGTRTVHGCKTQGRCWELNLLPPEKYPVLLTTESALQTPNSFKKFVCACVHMYTYVYICIDTGMQLHSLGYRVKKV